jgi:predicted Zn-dependent peptidase
MLLQIKVVNLNPLSRILHPIPKLHTAVLATLLLLVGICGEAQAVTLPQTMILTMTLPNGLEACLVEDHQAPIVDVQVWYHVGSKNEAPGRGGFAHLFEHLMFDGTTNTPAEQFSDYVIRSGGIDNAYTTEDSTVFWETTPSSQLPVVLWLEADRMRNLDITAAIFNNEKEVVEEERRLKFDNPPYGTVVETLYQHAYTVHPYQHMTIGSMHDLDNARIEDIRDFYDTYYVPNNATLVIVGDLNLAETESMIRKYFGPLERGAHPLSHNIPQEPPQTAERVVKLSLNVALPAFVEGYHMPADGTPDAYPLRLASNILSEGESSRIYRRLVYEKQIAVEAESTGNFTEDPNLFFVFAVMNQGHPPAEGEAEVEAELARLKTQPVSDEELQKAKNQILRDFILTRQTVQTRGEELGYAAVILKDANLVNTELARFLAVTPADIQRVAQKYFVPENLTLVEVYPKSTAGGEQVSDYKAGGQ